MYSNNLLNRTKFIALILLVTTLATFAPTEIFANSGSTNSDESSVGKKVTICHATHSESNPYVKITISESAVEAHMNHQDGEDVFADIDGRCPGDDRGSNDPVNEAPVISLSGDSVLTIFKGEGFVDPGATASDYEDGDITSKIVVSGNVDHTTVGTYVLTYNVSDSKGLSANPVERTVNVIEKPVQLKGKITFCIVLSDDAGNIATSSNGLPVGKFTINLATTTSNISSTTIRTKIWNTGSFSPNAKTILNENESDCVTYDDLDYDTYLYSKVLVEGSDWGEVLYNDQYEHGVMSLSDFFPYGNTDTNSDGVVIIGEGRGERTVYVLSKYKKTLSCLLPEITSSFSASGVVNQSFIYNLTASSTSQIAYNVSTSTLPSGLSYSTTTNSIVGSPTISGTFNVELGVGNSCGLNQKILVITINNPSNGGGGETPSANIAITKVSDVSTTNASSSVTYTITVSNSGPNTALGVSVNDVLPNSLEFLSASTTIGSYATTTGVWFVGDMANGSSSKLVINVNVKSGTEGQKIINTASASSTVSDPDTANNTSTSEININPSEQQSGGNGGGGGGTVVNTGSGGGGGGGGNGPIVGSYGGQIVSTGGGFATSTTPVVFSDLSCNYLNDYLRRDFNNNPIEVTKLQAFLRILEGEVNLSPTGVYDDATVEAVNRFQVKYFEDILAPWGHTGPTAYTYILTKKKVNEIFCNKLITLSQKDQDEIITYRNRGVQSSVGGQDGVGGEFEVGYGSGAGSDVIGTPKDTSGNVGLSTTTSTTEDARFLMTTLAGFTSTTRNIANVFTANTIEFSKKLSNFLLSLFGWPFGLNQAEKNQCELGYDTSRLLNLILLIVVVVLAYLWYRQIKRNKKLHELNKEIDLV